MRGPHATTIPPSAARRARGSGGAAKAMDAMGALRTRHSPTSHPGRLAHATALRHTACATAAQHCRNHTQRLDRPSSSLSIIARAPSSISISLPSHNEIPPPTVSSAQKKTLGAARAASPPLVACVPCFTYLLKTGLVPLAPRPHVIRTVRRFPLPTLISPRSP